MPGDRWQPSAGHQGPVASAKPAQVLAFGVSKAIRGTAVLDGTDLAVEGGLITLLGPNGAGKTTLLRCLATVWTVDWGSILIDGLNPAFEQDRTEIRRRLGYLPQEPGLAASARVFDAVDFTAVMKQVGAGRINPERARRLEVVELLGEVGVGDRMHDPVSALSGGMKRRVGLAQALLGSPSLLVLDEPAVGLDPEERARLRSILAARRSRATVIQSTHLTEEASYSDRVLVMSDGRLVFDGSPGRLAHVAEGRVWVQTQAPSGRHGHIRAHWQQADGSHRCLGTPPPEAEPVPATIEDGYLLVQRQA